MLLNWWDDIGHLVFTFNKTRTQQLLQTLWIPFFLYGKDSIALKESLGMVKYIIWFWDYTGRDQDKLKFESKCNNTFRNTFSEGGDKIQFDLFVPKTLDMEKYNVGKNWMGNGFCNRACYELCRKAENEWIGVAIVFVHVPKYISFQYALNQISQIISYLNYSITTSL